MSTESHFSTLKIKDFFWFRDERFFSTFGRSRACGQNSCQNGRKCFVEERTYFKLLSCFFFPSRFGNSNVTFSPLEDGKAAARDRYSTFSPPLLTPHQLAPNSWRHKCGNIFEEKKNSFRLLFIAHGRSRRTNSRALLLGLEPGRCGESSRPSSSSSTFTPLPWRP